MTLILVIELVSTALSGWYFGVAWRCYRTAQARHLRYQSQELNGSKGRALRARAERWHELRQFNAVFVVVNSAVVVWRLYDAWQHLVPLAAGTRDLQILYATWWARRWIVRTLQEETEITAMRVTERKQES